MAEEARLSDSPSENAKGVVLVTGASGFIGSAVIQKLGNDYQVVGLDRAGPPAPPSTAVAIDFDLGSDEAILSAFEEVRSRFGNTLASVLPLRTEESRVGKECVSTCRSRW